MSLNIILELVNRNKKVSYSTFGLIKQEAVCFRVGGRKIATREEHVGRL